MNLLSLLRFTGPFPCPLNIFEHHSVYTPSNGVVFGFYVPIECLDKLFRRILHTNNTIFIKFVAQVTYMCNYLLLLVAFSMAIRKWLRNLCKFSIKMLPFMQDINFWVIFFFCCVNAFFSLLFPCERTPFFV